MSRCAECGASLAEGWSCRDMFNELLRREYGLEFGPEAWRVHGLTVSSYVLQHPREHELKPFARARLTLEMVVRAGLSPEYVEGRVTRGSVGPGLAKGYEEDHRLVCQGEPVAGFDVTVADLLPEAEESHECRVMDWSRAALEGHYEALERVSGSRRSLS